MLTEALTTNDGYCHCDNGPALTFVDAQGNWLAEMWFENGSIHRIGAPAVSNCLGHQIWAVHGKYHRLNGPAVINDDGPSYYVNGVQVDVLEGFCASIT